MLRKHLIPPPKETQLWESFAMKHWCSCVVLVLLFRGKMSFKKKNSKPGLSLIKHHVLVLYFLMKVFEMWLRILLLPKHILQMSKGCVSVICLSLADSQSICLIPPPLNADYSLVISASCTSVTLCTSKISAWYIIM